MMKASDLHMDAKEMVNTMKALILALDEAIDYDRLQEATLRRLGEITEDQRAGLDEFFLELKALTITEEEVDGALKELHAETMMQEILNNEANDESEEPAE